MIRINDFDILVLKKKEINGLIIFIFTLVFFTQNFRSQIKR